MIIQNVLGSEIHRIRYDCNNGEKLKRFREMSTEILGIKIHEMEKIIGLHPIIGILLTFRKEESQIRLQKQKQKSYEYATMLICLFVLLVRDISVHRLNRKMKLGIEYNVSNILMNIRTIHLRNKIPLPNLH